MAGQVPDTLQLIARRGQPLALSVCFPPGVDLAGHEARMRVRSYPDGPTIHFDLPHTSYPIDDDDGPSASVWVTTIGPLPLSLLVFWIPQASIDAFRPFASNGLQPGEPLRLWWSVMVTPPGGQPGCWFEGPFLIAPGDPE